MKTKYIVFMADVQATQVSKLREIITQCINQKYQKLYFLISSGGGNVFEGLSIATYIKSLPMATVMHNIGQVDSVATAIFFAGKERLSSQNASFMFHGVSMQINSGNFLEQQLKELHDGAKRLKADIANSISVNSGLPIAEIEKLMIDGGNILSAEEAKKKGFISSIIEPIIPSDADICSIGNA